MAHREYNKRVTFEEILMRCYIMHRNFFQGKIPEVVNQFYCARASVTGVMNGTKQQSLSDTPFEKQKGLLLSISRAYVCARSCKNMK